METDLYLCDACLEGVSIEIYTDNVIPCHPCERCGAEGAANHLPSRSRGPLQKMGFFRAADSADEERK